MDEKYIGSSFDSFLGEENIREEVEAEAVKKIIAYALLEKLQTEHLTKRDLARKMGTLRAALDRLLDPNNLLGVPPALSNGIEATPFSTPDHSGGKYHPVLHPISRIFAVIPSTARSKSSCE